MCYSTCVCRPQRRVELRNNMAPHTRLGIEVLKKQLNMDFINLPSKDEYVTCIDKDKMLLFPRYPIDIYFYTIFHNVTRINLFGTGVFGDIAHLQWLPNLTHIYLFSTGLTGDIAHLQSLIHLNVLTIGSTDITGDIKHLKS